jgi:hypothetical protein
MKNLRRKIEAFFFIKTYHEIFFTYFWTFKFTQKFRIFLAKKFSFFTTQLFFKKFQLSSKISTWHQTTNSASTPSNACQWQNDQTRCNLQFSCFSFSFSAFYSFKSLSRVSLNLKVAITSCWVMKTLLIIKFA